MIYIVWAPPRQGKTYFCTDWAVKALRDIAKGSKRYKRVLSNYPIFDSKSGLWSDVWERRLAFEHVTDSLIIIDEAYRDYNSRTFKGFSPEEHTFFATNGHNANDIVVIAQNPARVDVVIREMCNVFFHVRKHQPFFMKRPLYFTVEGFTSEEDFAKRYSSDDFVYSRERILFRSRTARAYDTHYFRNESGDVNYVSWGEKIAIPESLTE